MAKNEERYTPAVAEFIKKKNDGVPVTNQLGSMNEAAIKLAPVLDTLNSDLTAAQIALNFVERDREAAVDKLRAKNPDVKGEAAYAQLDPSFGNKVENIVERAERRIRTEFKKAEVGQYADEAATAIISSMKAHATENARTALDKEALKKTATGHDNIGHGGVPNKPVGQNQNTGVRRPQ